MAWIAPLETPRNDDSSMLAIVVTLGSASDQKVEIFGSAGLAWAKFCLVFKLVNFNYFRVMPRSGATHGGSDEPGKIDAPGGDLHIQRLRDLPGF